MLVSAGIGGWIKLIGLQMVHSFINARKITPPAKLILYFFVFTANWWYTSNGYITNRPHTLYDHFNVSRLANFEELKAAKDDYLFNLRNLHDVNYTGNKDALVNYTMTE